MTVQIAGRLIANQDGGIGDQSARDGDSLLLSTRQFAWGMLAAVGEPHQFKGGLDFAFALAGGQRRQQQRQFDIALGGQRRH